MSVLQRPIQDARAATRLSDDEDRPADLHLRRYLSSLFKPNAPHPVRVCGKMRRTNDQGARHDPTINVGLLLQEKVINKCRASPWSSRPVTAPTS